MAAMHLSQNQNPKLINQTAQSTNGTSQESSSTSVFVVSQTRACGFNGPIFGAQTSRSERDVSILLTIGEHVLMLLVKYFPIDLMTFGLDWEIQNNLHKWMCPWRRATQTNQINWLKFIFIEFVQSADCVWNFEMQNALRSAAAFCAMMRLVRRTDNEHTHAEIPI